MLFDIQRKKALLIILLFLVTNIKIIQGIITQHFDRFYVFVSDEDFNRFADEFIGQASVTEIIPKCRLRYPVFDLDTKYVREFVRYNTGRVEV